GWWRTTAQRLLLERQDPGAIEPLRELVMSSPEPVARVTAGWLLYRFGELNEELIGHLLRDDHPRVRAQALALGEPPLAPSMAIQERAFKLASDADARVRFQAALSLGEWDSDRIVQPLADIALRGADDRWTRWVVASSANGRAGALVAALLRPGDSLRQSVT